jgi:hypothetical protein
MACGCNKKQTRRTQAMRVGNVARAPAQRTNIVNATANKNVGLDPKTKLNDGGLQAEKRRVQALRRTAILKSLGKI